MLINNFNLLKCLFLFNPLPLPPFSEWFVPQGYVTVNEINELYSQLGVDPTPAPLPTQAQSSPDAPATGSDPSPDPSPAESTVPPGEGEVCDQDGLYVFGIKHVQDLAAHAKYWKN